MAVLSVSHITEYQYSARVELGHPHRPPDPAQRRPSECGSIRAEHRSGAERPAQRDRRVRQHPLVFFLFSLRTNGCASRPAAGCTLSDRYPDLDPAASPDWQSVRDRLQYRAGVPYVPASEFVFASPVRTSRPGTGRATRWPVFAPGRPLVDACDRTDAPAFTADFRYRPASTEISTPVLQAFSRERTGGLPGFLARDDRLSALDRPVGSLRSSGYLVTVTAARERKRPIGADASHAWISVHCPELGWVDLDATNDMIPRQRPT